MSTARTGGAVAGVLIAGVALSAVMLAGEKASGKPSELIELKRKAAARLDIASPICAVPATAAKQLITHGGHLALAGLAYAAMVEENADRAASGAVFGLAFFIAAYGITGPALDVTPPPWREQPFRAVQHPVVHTLFGLTTALFARKANFERPVSSKRRPGR